MFQDSDDLNQHSLIRQQFGRNSSRAKKLQSNQNELDMILNQSVDHPQTFLTQSWRRSNSVQHSAHGGESSVMFFEQVEQLRKQMLALRQENKQLLHTNRALQMQIDELQHKLSGSSARCAFCNNALHLAPNENDVSNLNSQLQEFIADVRKSQPITSLKQGKRTLSCSKDKLQAVRLSLPTRRITVLKNENKYLSVKRKPEFA